MPRFRGRRPRTRNYGGPYASDDEFSSEVHADETSDMETTDDSDVNSDSDGLVSDMDSDPDIRNIARRILAATASAASAGSSTDEFVDLDDQDSDTSDTGEGDFAANWKDGPRPRGRVDLPFTGQTGLGQFKELPEQPKPIDYFEMFLQEDDYGLMATETNRYFHQECDDEVLPPKSRMRQWKDTNAEEMKVFVAMTIAMSLVVQRNFSEYWSTSDVTSTPFFPKCMPRDRFWLLLTFLHLSDNSTMPGRNTPQFSPLNKLGILYNRIIHRFSRVYIPHQHISVDEGLVPWKGNLSFKVYNPDKPKKYGIKAYMLCDSHNGYVCKFKLYTGRTNEVSIGGKTYDLVMDLVKDYSRKGYHVYMDNFYSSVTLYINLWKCGFGATGTLRGNRSGIPVKLKRKTKKPEKGSMLQQHNKELLIVRYEDRKSVLLMSTVEDTEDVESGRKNRVTGEPITKPRIVHEYNKYMGGVDRAGQMLSYTPFKMKTLKWWKRVWFHILNVALLNAYVLYKELSKDKTLKTNREFRKEIVQHIITFADRDKVASLGRRPRGRRCTTDDSIVRLHGRHFPSKIEPVGRKKNLSRTCVVCSKARRELLRRGAAAANQPARKKKRVGRESCFECLDCNVALCVEPCFRLYHTSQDFCKAYISMIEREEEDGDEDN